jgi:hypothetical protein
MHVDVNSEPVPPDPIEVDGVLTAVTSVVWTEEVIEIDGTLEEAP